MKQFYAFNDLTNERKVVRGIDFSDALNRAGIKNHFGWSYDAGSVTYVL